MLALSRIALARTDRGDRGGLAAFGFYALVGVAVAVNYARGNPAILVTDLGQAAEAVPAVLPPLSATLAYKVLQGERRSRARQLATTATPAAASRPADAAPEPGGHIDGDAGHPVGEGAALPIGRLGQDTTPPPVGPPSRVAASTARAATPPPVAPPSGAATATARAADGAAELGGLLDPEGGRPAGENAPRPAGHLHRQGGHPVGEPAPRSRGQVAGRGGLPSGGAGAQPEGGPGGRNGDAGVGLLADPSAGLWARVAAAVAAEPGVRPTKQRVADATGIPRPTVRRLVAEHQREWDAWVDRHDRDRAGAEVDHGVRR